MKCPKCSYLGFETGDRCKNCGYDFSLLPDADIPSPEPEYDLNADLILRDAEPDSVHPNRTWHDTFDSIDNAPPATVDAPTMRLAVEPSPFEPAIERPPLPLFARHVPTDDEPLVKLPAVPRQPLSVRRTPDTPRLRSMPKDVPRVKATIDPVFQFSEDPDLMARAR